MPKGKIQVTIQREDRLSAIKDLSKAILATAQALNAAPTVIIHDCHVENSEAGIVIEIKDIVTRTEIADCPDDS